MIGQKQLKEQFNTLIVHNRLPKSMLLIGLTGSGRKTFANWVSAEMGIPSIEINNGIDDIRELIELSNKSVKETLYIVPNIEQMSAAAQNSLLKVLEEPPKNAYFILTATQENLVLSTIHSRCVVFYMDHYGTEELLEYAKTYISELDDATITLITDVCSCPGEVQTLLGFDVAAFYKYAEQVFNNIAKVSGANSFKIGNKINLADDGKKYDLTLFWKLFVYLCMSNIDNNMPKYSVGVKITMRALQDLRIKGINKQMLFDTWILNIRKEWLNADN